MSQPPKLSDLDQTSRRIPAVDDAQPVAGSVENRLPFGAGGEGLCHTMPELGSIPYVSGREKSRRVVRLVSANAESDLSIELQAGVNKVGRQRNGNHIVLVSGEISRFHAELHVSDDAILVRDLDSSNGTFVNGKRVKESRVEAGDTIGFSSQFLFKLQIDMAMQSPEVMTLEHGGREPLPHAVPGPAAAPHDDVPSSLEERRRKLEEAPPVHAAHSTAPRGVAPLPRPAVPKPIASSTARPPAASPPTPIMPGPARTAVSPSPRGATPAAPPEAGQPARLRAAPPVRAPQPRAQAVARQSAAAAPAAPAAAALSAGDSLLEPIKPVENGAAPGDLSILERERRQLAVLYQVSKRCMAAENLAELDRLLINVLERVVAFERGFITYQLPSGDWKLVMSPKGDRWDRTVVRNLLQTALRGKSVIVVKNSAGDDQLGSAGPGRTDARLLLPLRTRSAPVGAIFLISGRADSFDEQTVDFLSLFSDIAALAVVNCARIEGRASP